MGFQKEEEDDRLFKEIRAENSQAWVKIWIYKSASWWECKLMQHYSKQYGSFFVN